MQVTAMILAVLLGAGSRMLTTTDGRTEREGRQTDTKEAHTGTSDTSELSVRITSPILGT